MPRLLALSLVLLAAAVGCDESSIPSATHGGDASTAAPTRCSPAGQSVACIGVGSCRGAQVCNKDGSFGACECGMAAAATCGLAGNTAPCFGPGACQGAQVCGKDGNFGACQCAPPLPSFDAGGATVPIVLHVTQPTDNQLWKGVVTLSGTTTGPAAAVGISIGGGPFFVATGTSTWSASFDSAHMPNGTLEVVVAAQGAGQDVRWTGSVIVDNVDPVVGGWQLQGNGPYLGGRSCRIYFLPSGAYSDPCGAMAYGTTWRRETPDTISIGSYVFHTSFSGSGRSLQLTRQGSVVFNLVLVQLIDPYLPSEDGGVSVVDYDGGTYYPPPVSYDY